MTKKLSNKEAWQIITEEGLLLHQDLWHFSFNPVFDYREYYFDKKNKVVYSLPLNQWSPMLVYLKHSFFLPQNNFITEKTFDRNNKEKRKIFWYLHTTTFDDFLNRRSLVSSQPAKNFPSIQTYQKKIASISGMRFEVCDFDMQFFKHHYNSLNKDGYLSAEEVYKASVESIAKIPESWLRLACLCHANEVKAIMLIVEDGRSVSFINMASERTSYGYGLVLCVELVKYCTEKNYHSFDSGISGMYGNYKEKIFLDSKEIFSETKQKNTSVLAKLKSRIFTKGLTLFSLL